MRIEELKQKFVDLQQSHQTLREDKIRLESQLKALDADYQEKLKQLLEVTVWARKYPTQNMKRCLTNNVITHVLN